MPFSRDYLSLTEGKEKVPVHLVTKRGSHQLRCFCDLTIKVMKRNIVRIQDKQHLACPQCNDELRRWEEFFRVAEEKRK